MTVARAMAGGLSGMPGDVILLLDSWMEQKGVDGFSLSVSSFHIQQIRVAGCCGDRAEEGSGTPAPWAEQPVWTQTVLGADFCGGNHNNNNKRGSERKGGRQNGGKGREGGRNAPSSPNNVPL